MLFKVGDVDIILKLSPRELHSQRDEGIQDFCEILVRFKVHIYIFLLFLKWLSDISLTKEGIISCM